MKAKIDIQTPAGKSLEGFPQEYTTELSDFWAALDEPMWKLDPKLNIQLHPGDKITIEILP